MKKTLLFLFLMVLFIPLVRAQDRTVTGRVTASEDGTSLPGVNVILKGTSNGAVTDAEGNYTLTIPASGGSLVFSFIGLQTTEIPIGDRTVVDVSLGLDVTQLSEVVVTGVGVATDKRRLAISVESLSGDKLPVLPSASIDQALVGKIAGAQIMSASGSPGTPVSIQLRGINTLSGGTQPLIMVDGMQMQSTSLNSLDLSNVERIEVVQGASAATIYGAQGANGVIQIFTKKGKAGKMKIDFGARTSIDNYLNIGDLRQAKNHSFTVDSNGDMLDTDGNLLEVIPPGFWPAVNWENDAGAKNDKPYQNNTQWYDHVDQLFNTASTSNINLSVSGGKDNSDYAFSVANLKQESVINGGLDRTNFTANVGFEIARGLTFRSTTQLIYSDNTANPFAGGGAEGGYLSAAFYTWPFADFTAQDDAGNYLYKFGGAGA
ncbi:MAG TPA: TonB-dependent receptor plug domain-containing protein, partial [Chryseolinea sp.]|nr:TonB-dependent receptor plug domain-containing protein [Chryseolinea sp.]